MNLGGELRWCQHLCAPRTTWQNWRTSWRKKIGHRVLVLGKVEYKTEILQIDKRNCICSKDGLQGRCFRPMSCTYTWEHFVPLLICFLLVGGDWDSSQMVVQNFLSLNNNKLQAARRIFWEHFAISWTRSFTVTITESSANSRGQSIPTLDTEKIVLLYRRLKVYKERLEMIFWLTVWTNGKSTRLCLDCKNFCFFWHNSIVADSIWRRNFSKS